MLIGDPGVGKTSVRRRYLNNKSPTEPVQSWQHQFMEMPFDLHSSPILPNGQLKRRPWIEINNVTDHTPKLVNRKVYFETLSTWPEPPRFGVSRFEFIDVVAICYDCSRPQTLYNAIYKWCPIVLHKLPQIPIFLLGCKSDLKEKQDDNPIVLVTSEDAKKAALQIGAIDVFECTAMGEDSTNMKKICDTFFWYGYYSHSMRRGGVTTSGGRIQGVLDRIPALY
ncbi:hypothetical protein CPB86DRAFT_781276 [Serendipita vermifera]|nr:hypothetical protein CPB86DRAFT_781276 [Serendipita vermifera]